jgi:hypothetical protein
MRTWGDWCMFGSAVPSLIVEVLLLDRDTPVAVLP